MRAAEAVEQNGDRPAGSPARRGGIVQDESVAIQQSDQPLPRGIAQRGAREQAAEQRLNVGIAKQGQGTKRDHGFIIASAWRRGAAAATFEFMSSTQWAPRRVVLFTGISVAVLVAALAWSRLAKPRGYVTPEDCLGAFRDATLDGDAARYRGCLGEPLRSQVQQSYPYDAALATALREGIQGVKHWVEAGAPQEQGDRAVASVDEVRVTGQRRLRVYLERSHAGWLVVRVEKGDEKPAAVRYGTTAQQPSRPEPGEEP